MRANESKFKRAFGFGGGAFSNERTKIKMDILRSADAMRDVQTRARPKAFGEARAYAGFERLAGVFRGRRRRRAVVCGGEGESYGQRTLRLESFGHLGFV